MFAINKKKLALIILFLGLFFLGSWSETAQAETRALLVCEVNHEDDNLDRPVFKRDQEVMTQLFERMGVAQENIVTLTDVRFSEVEQAIGEIATEQISSQANDDLVYIFLEAHGARQGFISFSNGKNSDLVAVEKLKREFDRIQGKKVIILLSCYAGNFIEKNDLGQEYVVIGSSTSQEPSYGVVSTNTGMTDFVYALITGCGGLPGGRVTYFADDNDNKEITLSELHQWLLWGNPYSDATVFPVSVPDKEKFVFMRWEGDLLSYIDYHLKRVMAASADKKLIRFDGQETITVNFDLYFPMDVEVVLYSQHQRKPVDKVYHRFISDGEVTLTCKSLDKRNNTGLATCVVLFVRDSQGWHVGWSQRLQDGDEAENYGEAAGCQSGAGTFFLIMILFLWFRRRVLDFN